MIKKKISDIVNSGWFMLLVYGVVSVAYLWPFLRHPAFNLIDDGWSLQTAQTLLSNLDLNVWKNTLVETNFGRLRPLYYLYFLPLYAFFKFEPLAFWVAQAVVLTLTLWLLWKVSTAIAKDSALTRVAPLIFLAFPSVVENLNRLGTAEPRQFIFHLAYTWWLTAFFRKKVITTVDWWWVTFLLLLNFISKESSLILIPMTVLVIISKWIVNKRVEKSEVGMTVWVVLLTLGFLASLPARTGYTAGYQINPLAMIRKVLEMRLEQAELYWPLAILVTATCLRVISEYLFTKPRSLIDSFNKMVWPGVLLTGLGLSLVLLLPWEHAKLERYLYVVIGFFIVYLGSESTLFIESLKKWWLKKEYALIVGICLMLIVLIWGEKKFVFHNFGTRYVTVLDRAFDAQRRLYKEYQLSYPLVSHLLNITPENAQIFVGDEDYERIMHIGLFGSQLNQRPIKVLTTNALVPQDYGERFVAIGTESATLSQLFLQDECVTECYFIYRPHYFKPAVFGELPNLAATEVEPQEMGNAIPTVQRWHIIKKP